MYHNTLGRPSVVDLVEEALYFLDGGFALSACSVPVVLGGEVIDAEKGLEKELCETEVFLGERSAWFCGEIAEELGMFGHEIGADGG